MSGGIARLSHGWDDIAPYYITGQGANVAAAAAYGTTGFVWYKLTATDGKDEELQYSFQIPHRWQAGTAIEPHLHVVPSANGSAGNEDVKMQISYQWVNIGEAYGTASSDMITPAAKKFTVSATGGNKHTLWDFDAITASGKTLSGDLAFIVRRLSKTDATDNYTGDIWLRYIDLHVEIDSLGSITELSK